MKKAFTLIEMMIVVAVLTTLITLVFRLAANTDDQTARVKTIMRLQRLENCLSGFYAAFGSYPPVALHGSRDIYSEVNDVGVQKDGGERNENIWDDETLAWKQVRAACKSQPVACNFPFDDKEYFQMMIEQWSEQCKQVIDAAGSSGLDEEIVQQYSAGFSGLSNQSGAAGELRRYQDVSEWRKVQLFRFGLMSYLLPRYILMAASNPDFYQFAQWDKNNTRPHDPYTGNEMTWNALNSISRDIADDDDGEREVSRRNRNMIANIPTQKVCARWLPNLEGICTAPRSRVIYGIAINSEEQFPPTPMVEVSGAEPILKGFPSDLFTPGGKDGFSDQYLLDFISIQDGYGNDFYYYSPSPHQRYQLWSAGRDGKTFPPWIAKEDLPSEASELIHRWTKDDIIQMSH